MVLHLVGFVAAGLLANVWWLALVIIALTGALPWIAVVIANDRGRTDRSAPRYHAGRRSCRHRGDHRVFWDSGATRGARRSGPVLAGWRIVVREWTGAAPGGILLPGW